MKNKLLLLALMPFSTLTLAEATPAITGYNVQNALSSDFVTGWTHEYTGNIVNLANNVVSYTGGTGTLADGTLGTTTTTTQLFRTADNTSITIFLDNYYALESVSLFGGGITKAVSGSITGATFTNAPLNLSTNINSTAFGDNNVAETPVNDRFSFGTSLPGTPKTFVNQFTISNIQGNLGGYFTISEIQVAGTVLSPIPEPSTYALMLGGLGLVGFMAARRRRTA